MGFCCHGFGWGGWWGWGGLVLNLVFFAGLLGVLGLGGAWLIRQIGRPPRGPKVEVDPLEIARRRLAAGEITIAEFEEIRNRLRG
ncbi:MAG TPA: SHOCT domain-containing protein [Anaerolineae bacterium]|nr:SHOCT domain-containing protein [Anaerolineae bacterium]